MGDSPQSEPYVCTLPPELVEKAEKELNEKAEWRQRDICALREMVLKDKDLHIRTDDRFLLRFLRAKKFDYDRAFSLIHTYYQMRRDNAEIFQNMRPSAIKHILEAGVTGVMPGRDKEGRKVIILRPGKWDASRFSIDDVFRTNFLTMSKLIEDEVTQVNGIVMINDMNGVGWGHVKNISPFYAKRIMALLQDAFPARMKGIHYLNEPAVFDYVFAIIKQFMKEKTVSRLHFHGSNYSELLEFIDAEYLPEDYGGKGPKYSNKDWMDTLLQCDAQFDEEAKYGYVSSAQGSKEGKADAMECLVGSYRKLNVD